jgi:putative two-component system response regulator
VPPGSFLPVIVLTADVATDVRRRALAAGASDFLTKPFDATEVLLRIRNILRTRSLHVALESQNEVLDRRVRERTASLAQAVQRLTRSENATRRATEETIHRLAAAAELRDEETGSHIQRMSRYAALLAGRAGLDADRCELIRLASLLHDIGKIGVPDGILRKPGTLTPEEFEAMKEHAAIGCAVLAGSEAEVLQLAATIARTHHERVDGTGYPGGISAEAIPLEGRIAAIADVFDALTSPRIYRPAFSVDEAVHVMREGRGRHFDPALLDAFLDGIDDVLAIRASCVEERVPQRA